MDTLQREFDKLLINIAAKTRILDKNQNGPRPAYQNPHLRAAQSNVSPETDSDVSSDLDFDSDPESKKDKFNKIKKKFRAFVGEFGPDVTEEAKEKLTKLIVRRSNTISSLIPQLEDEAVADEAGHGYRTHN